MPGLKICLIILNIWQAFEDAPSSKRATGSEYGTVVYARVTQSSECLNMAQFASVMPENTSICLKSYLHYKNISCHRVALDVSLRNFFTWRENNVLFLKYLDFCVFVKSTDFKIFDAIIGIATFWELHLCLFLLNPTKYY